MSNKPRELLELPENWDSYEGKKITEEAVKTAEAVLVCTSV